MIQVVVEFSLPISLMFANQPSVSSGIIYLCQTGDFSHHPIVSAQISSIYNVWEIKNGY